MGTSPPQPVQSVALRQGLGNQDGVNVLQLAGAKVFLRLCFTDPEGTKRFFPPELPVRVEFGGGGTARSANCTLGLNGRLTFLARGGNAEAWREFTLQFPANAGNPRYCVYEARGASASPPGSPPAVPRIDNALPNTQERYFRMPVDFPAGGSWGLRHSDWTAGAGANAFPANATFTANTGIVRHSQDPPLDIGTVDEPVELILNPHWKFFRFVHFDRYNRPVAWTADPQARGIRVSIPPVSLEGFRGQPNPATGDAPDTQSNWTIGANEDEIPQCLPWILQRDAGGAALPRLQGGNLGLRFRPGDNIYVYSRPGSPPPTPGREIVTVPLGDARLQPGADRLRYYHLPPCWKSRGYYTRNLGGAPPADGKFFPVLTEGDLDRADARGTPFIFSLDDIVLTDAALAQVELPADQRVSVFHHRFANRAPASPTPAAAAEPLLTEEGIYIPAAATDLDLPNQEGFPYSSTDLVDPLARGGHGRFYIFDYPDWTRLVIAQGNLFDAFDDRTPDTNEVAGARAAVRRVDATVAPNGWAPPTNIGALARPALQGNDSFSIQPCYFEEFLNRGHNPPGPVQHFEWNNAYTYAPVTALHQVYRNARFDIALLRCCDHDGDDEISILFRFHRISINFPGFCNTLARREDFARDLVTNVNRRWNSRDTVNQDCGWIVPRAVSPPEVNPAARLKTKVLTFVQFLKNDWAHYRMTPINPANGSAVGVATGTGKLRANCVVHDGGGGGTDAYGVARSSRGLAAAHEIGHAHGMPDDYIPSDDYAEAHAFYTSNHVIGNPYAVEGLSARPDQSLMQLNWQIRARYLWYCAEWLRTAPGLAAAQLKISHGADENDFQLPHYQHTATHPGRNYMSWPICFNIRQRNVVVDRSCFDSYLYMLGADLYSTNRLPARVVGGAGDRVDGVVVVMLRVKFDFAGIPGGFPAGDRGALYLDVSQRFHNALTLPRKTARFQVFQAVSPPPAPPLPSFKRCMLEFRFCVLTAGEADDADNEAASPPHLAVTFATLLGAQLEVWVDVNPPAAKSLELHVPADYNVAPAGPPANPGGGAAAWRQHWAQRIYEYSMRTLGLTTAAGGSPPPVAPNFQAADSYIPIVRTVMDANAPPPVITV